MRFMMNRIVGLLIALFIPNLFSGQTNNLTGSPYSLFGLGITSNSNIGKNSALGKGGYAISGEGFINALNPASYGSIGPNSFLLDFGLLAELSTISNSSTEERRIAGSFSNIAIAASVTKKSALGLSITPFTDVGYSLIGIESNVEGSFNEFTSNVFGSGALNDFRLSYGVQITDNIRIGSSLSYLFGTIEEREAVNASANFTNQSTLSITDSNRYKGLRLALGLQYQIQSKFILGWGINLPTSLSGSRDRIVRKTLDFAPFEVSSENDIELDDFELPLELNAGLLFQVLPNLNMNLDYALKLWTATDQEDNIGIYTDQFVFGLGAEYVPNARGLKFWQRLGFRAGFNYDSGYLVISDNTINTTSFTAGLGIPLGIRSLSQLNISVARSQRGNTQGILVEERFNTINVNLSLKDFWFLKRKID